MRAAIIAEDFLEAGNDFPGARIAGRKGAAGAGIAALEIDFAEAEAHRASFFFAEELILPERGHAFDLERGAEALARFVEVHTAKQIANSLQARGGNNGRAIGDGVIRESFGKIRNVVGLSKKVENPLWAGFGFRGEAECFRWIFAPCTRNRQGAGY